MNSFEGHPIEDETRWKRVWKGLERLPTRGVDQWWIIERSPALLDLKIVQQAAPQFDGQTEDERLVKSLVSNLNELVAEFDGEPHALVLKIVMCLEPTFVDRDGKEHHLFSMTAEGRRDLAGNHCFGGHKTVGADAIRNKHEKVAVQRLAVMLLRREVATSGFWLAENEPTVEGLDRVLVYLPRELVPKSGRYGVRDKQGHPLQGQATFSKGERFPQFEEGSVEYGWALIGEGGAADTISG